MNPANATNAPASDRTSSNAPGKSENAEPRSDAHLTESEFLRAQAEAASAAIAGAFSELKSDLAAGADPRIWMKSHPWITLASAAVAGFAAAAAVVPSKDEQALRKLAAIERALDASNGHKDSSNGNHSKPKEGGILATVMHELLTAIKPMVMALLTSRMQSNPHDGAPDPDSHNP